MEARNREALAALVLVALPACATLFGPAAPPQYPRVVTDACLELQDIVVPDGGAVVEAGDDVALHYAGWLVSGDKIDSSYDRGEPIRFTVGFGMVPPGLDRGILGMRRGGRRCLIVPAALAFGKQGIAASIPPCSRLIFDVEVVEIEKGGGAVAGRQQELAPAPRD